MVVDHLPFVSGGIMCTRVNKITVSVNTKYDETKISLYKTNELLGILTDEELALPSFSNSGVSLKSYQAYCKDYVIELLNNDGIVGYYYEPKADNSIKHNTASFKLGVKEYIDAVIKGKYEYSMPMSEKIDIIDRYKDGYIKNAVGEFDIILDQFDVRITVLSEIKSGQLCRPKTILYNNIDYGFNITNIGRIIRSV